MAFQGLTARASTSKAGSPVKKVKRSHISVDAAGAELRSKEHDDRIGALEGSNASSAAASPMLQEVGS